MKFITAFILGIFLVACNQQDNPKENQKDTAVIQPAPVRTDTPANTLRNNPELNKKDSELLRLSTQVLAAIKAHDWKKLVSFADPVGGIRFSPYAYVDTNTAVTLRPAKLIDIAKNRAVIMWGEMDGSAEPIRLTWQQYVDRFVYSKDFLNAPEPSVNHSKHGGNSLDNLAMVYPKAAFTEFYIAGTDPKSSGMDWQLLRLVFDTTTAQPKLIAIVHDEWTI